MTEELRRARMGVSAAFVLHSAVFGAWAPRVAAIKHQAGLSDGELGLALTGFAAGLLAGTRLAGRPIDRFGSRPVLRAGLPLLGASLVLPALSHGLVGLAVALVVFGVLGGFTDVAINAQGVAVERRAGRPIMAGLHGLWSVGLLVSSAAAAGAAHVGASPPVHFAIVATLVAGGSLLAIGSVLPRSAEVVPTSGGERAALWSGTVLLLGLVGFCSFVGEGSAADWSAVYLRDDLGAGAAVAAGGFVAFSAGMVSARFMSDRLAVRFGPVALVRAASLVAAGGLAVGLALDRTPAALVGFALLGAGLGPVVPIVFSSSGNTGLGSTGAVLGRVVTIGYLGSILGPIAIGLAASRIGLRAALWIPVALALLIAVGAGRLTLNAPSAERAEAGGTVEQ